MILWICCFGCCVYVGLGVWGSVFVFITKCCLSLNCLDWGTLVCVYYLFWCFVVFCYLVYLVPCFVGWLFVVGLVVLVGLLFCLFCVCWFVYFFVCVDFVVVSLFLFGYVLFCLGFVLLVGLCNSSDFYLRLLVCFTIRLHCIPLNCLGVYFGFFCCLCLCVIDLIYICVVDLTLVWFEFVLGWLLCYISLGLLVLMFLLVCCRFVFVFGGLIMVGFVNWCWLCWLVKWFGSRLIWLILVLNLVCFFFGLLGLGCVDLLGGLLGFLWFLFVLVVCFDLGVICLLRVLIEFMFDLSFFCVCLHIALFVNLVLFVWCFCLVCFIWVFHWFWFLFVGVA